jgi:hypothetical protein
MAQMQIPYDELKMIFGDAPASCARSDRCNPRSDQVLVSYVWDQVQALELPYPKELFTPVAVERMRLAYHHGRGATLGD